MKLTGKAKEDFEKWYELNYEAIVLRSIDDEFYLDGFYELPESFKYGVYVDWFGSVGIILDPQPVLDYDDSKYTKVNNWLCNVTKLNDTESWDMNTYETRPEARTKAIEKANEIYNN